MFDVPDHLLIPVDAAGRGPLDEGDPAVAGEVCWCADGPACRVVVPVRWRG